MMIIKYNRRSLCAGDDVYNGVYPVELPDDAVLSDLIEVLLRGGNGNDWPIPYNHTGWDIYSNIGRIAGVSPDQKQIEYCDGEGNTKLAALGVSWVFGEYKGDTPHMLSRKYLFRD